MYRSKHCQIEPLESRIAPAAFVVTTLSDTAASGTLREAVTAANIAGGASTITFRPGLHGTLNLSAGPLVITGDVTINGPGAGAIHVDAYKHSQVFVTGPGAVSISGLTITGGMTTGSGGDISSTGPLTLNKCAITGGTASYGGGLYFKSSSGELIVTDSVVSGNKAPTQFQSIGGGIDIDQAGGGAQITSTKIMANSSAGTPAGLQISFISGQTAPIVITDSVISGNSGYGGLEVSGASNATLEISKTTISSNISYVGGAGYIYAPSGMQVTISNSTISKNKATAIGGLQLNGPGSFTLSGCVISGNTAPQNGGAISIDMGASLTLQNCTLTGNRSLGSGGAVYIGPQASSLTVQNSTFSGNRATDAGGAIGGAGSLNLTVTDSHFIKNEAAPGGAIGTNLTGTTSISGSTFSGNVSPTLGGGAYLAGSGNITIAQSTFTGNKAVTFGGGGLAINSSATSVTLTSNIITANRVMSNRYGGGIYIEASLNFTISGGKIGGNFAGGQGGGIDIQGDSSGTITLPGITITGNHSGGYGGGVANQSTGTVTMNTSLVTGNFGIPGPGGIYRNTYGTFA